MAHGANLNHQSTDGTTPLTTAAMPRNYDLAYEMLMQGADPTIKDQWGYDLVGMIRRYGGRGTRPGSADHSGYLKIVAELKKRGLLP